MQSPQNCGLSIGITVNGLSYFYNYGETERDSKKVCSANTIYEIGSITKTFCGVLFAKAVVEGKLKENDELSKFLPGKYPELNLNGKAVLLKHLVNHTSGLPGIPDNLRNQPNFDSLNPYKNYTKEMLYSYLKTVKLESEPGIEFSYSNTGMALLGLVLEDVYGKSFEELVKEKICIPNGMTATTIQLSDEQQKLFAQGHNSEGSATSHWDLGIFKSAGALRSSSSDMLRFLDYNLKEEDKAAVLSHKPTFNGRSTIGLAWFIKKTKSSNTLIWHNGGTEGFRSFAGFIKEKKCSVVVLSNSAMDVDFIAIAVLDYLQK
ncbi:MAG: beta-lactamase family protein [Bacteroidia bacterium]|nr:beta-lactamase family protein [Bacteroidia bacterium]